MANSDRDHWNLRYTEKPWPDEPSPWLVANIDRLGQPGIVLDVAGGTGRNAVWLARRGWDVTVLDVSDVALTLARDRAEELHVPLRTERFDLAVSLLPEGPWHLVMLFHYLDRALFPRIASVLAPGGVFIGSLATVANLERNERPPRPYLLASGELPSLMEDLELIVFDEGWQNDHCDARFVAHKHT